VKSNTRKQQDAESCDRCGVHVGNGSGVYVDNPHTGDEDRVCAECANKPHNCWHNCELTEALQCLAPAYGDEAHRKVAERMKQDMEAQITPGPWELEPILPSEQELACADGCAVAKFGIKGSDGVSVCRLWSRSRPYVTLPGRHRHRGMFPLDAEQAANARLIASAPDLLAAVEGLLRHCVTPAGMPDKGKGRTKEQQEAYDAALAAIAKVKGGAK